MSRVSPAFPVSNSSVISRTVDPRQMVDDIRRLQSGAQIVQRVINVEKGHHAALSRPKVGGQVPPNEAASAGHQDVHTATVPVFKASCTQSSFRRSSTISAWFIRCVLCEVYSSANETSTWPSVK